MVYSKIQALSNKVSLVPEPPVRTNPSKIHQNRTSERRYINKRITIQAVYRVKKIIIWIVSMHSKTYSNVRECKGKTF